MFASEASRVYVDESLDQSFVVVFMFAVFHRCSEYLGVKQRVSEINDFRYFVYSEYFRVRYSGVLLVLEVFQVWSLSILLALRVCWGSILWVTAVLRIYCGSLLWNTRSTWSFQWSCTALTLSTRSIWALYTASTSIPRVFQRLISRGTTNTGSISRFYTQR